MKKQKFLLLAIVILAAVVRFTYLDRIPSGFIPEEVSTGWNAYSLLKTGRDEWGTLLPMIFRETGGFKLALNSYLIVPVMAISGVNELAVRIPTAAAGVLAVYLTYILTRLLFKKETYALSAALFLAINPWHVAMGRYAVDVNWGIPLFLLGLTFFLKSLTRPRFLIASALFFALTYYTYFNYVVFTFLFILGLHLVKRHWLWSKPIRTYAILFLLIQILFLLPYILQPNLTIRFSQATSVGKIGLINRINEHRQACFIVYPSLVCKLLYNQPLAQILEIARNYINHYSTTPFFLYGSQLGLSGMPDRLGFFYLFEFLFLIAGLVCLIQQKKFSSILGLWFLLYGLPSSLAGEAHIWRMLTVLPLPQLVSGVGFIELSQRIKFKVFTYGFLLIIVFFISQYIADYTGYFPYFQGTNSYFGFRDAYQYIKTIEKDYNYIVVAPSGLGFDQLYIYYLFYMQPDPRAFQLGNEVDREVGEQGWVKVKRIGKWHFEGDVRNVVFSLPDKTLFVADGAFDETKPLPLKVMLPTLLHTIYNANGTPAFKILELRKNPEYKEAATR